ncbi:MAG: hypothetical protein JRI39_13035 [Deltaproteobacteria bacterium]|nr:hypothetical protein [Deltaproteobacteria bacterium]
MTKKRIGMIFLASVFIFTFFAVPAWSKDVIKIGVIGPMNFLQGKGHWNGATMAAEELNANEGRNHKSGFQRVFEHY